MVEAECFILLQVPEWLVECEWCILLPCACLLECGAVSFDPCAAWLLVVAGLAASRFAATAPSSPFRAPALAPLVVPPSVTTAAPAGAESAPPRLLLCPACDFSLGPVSVDLNTMT